MIRPIETPESAEANPQRLAQKTAGPENAAGQSFATMLARQKKTDGEQTQRAEGPKRAAKDPIDAPKGEMWRPVRGDDNYARILNGERRGMYVNLARGERRGDVFEVENRGGKRVHVYNKGQENEKVILAAKDSGKVHGHGHGGHEARAARHARNETWAPVEGAGNYADILSGPRNGYFVNTSGGERDGMVFHRVKRDGKILHIYGSGKHRQVVEVGRVEDNDKPNRTERSESGGRERERTEGTSGTGGASPDRPEQRPPRTKPERD